MSLELRILASGSSGNCSLVRHGRRCVMVDAGIGPRVAAKRLVGSGVSLDDIDAVVITHLDCDHFRSTLVAKLAARQVPIYVARRRLGEARSAVPNASESILPFDQDVEFHPVEGMSFAPIHLSHDAHGSHGFLIQAAGNRIGYATDLGRVPDALVHRFNQLSILAIESNYDPQMQRESARPWSLKKRIMGGSGHLSNEQAFEAVCGVLDRADRQNHPLPKHIVLLHRSRQCNCPKVIEQLFHSDGRIAPRLTLAHPFESTDWLGVSSRPFLPGEQMPLAFTAADNPPA